MESQSAVGATRCNQRTFHTQSTWRASVSEEFLAFHLRKLGVKFQRQAPIEKYHVDFLISPNLVVEAEGKVHSNRQERDAARTERLESLGYRVFRIPNYLIFAAPNSVAKMIREQSVSYKLCRPGFSSPSGKV